MSLLFSVGKTLTVETLDELNSFLPYENKERNLLSNSYTINDFNLQALPILSGHVCSASRLGIGRSYNV